MLTNMGIDSNMEPMKPDHKHRLHTVRPFDYSDAATLVAAFWQDVESVLREKGVWT